MPRGLRRPRARRFADAFARTVLVGYALTSSTATAELQPETVVLDVVITATGMHPSGGSFDGLRIFVLPVETTTVTPPDSRLLLIDYAGEHWVGGSEGGSPCPDAITCRFRNVEVDPSRPFALVVLDDDPWIARVVDSAKSVAELADSVRSRVGGEIDLQAASGGIAERGRRLLEGLPGLETLTEDARRLTERLPSIPDLFDRENDERDDVATGSDLPSVSLVPSAHDFVDALVVTPESGATDEEIDAIVRRVREAVEHHANTLLGNAERRVSGQLNVQIFEECALIACDLEYSTVLFLER